jgi:hypothetical protein
MHLAQTKVYFTGVDSDVIYVALKNFILPHKRNLRRSALHLLYSAIVKKINRNFDKILSFKNSK